MVDTSKTLLANLEGYKQAKELKNKMPNIQEYQSRYYVARIHLLRLIDDNLDFVVSKFQ